MVALENLREHWLGLGAELVVRATRSICDGSLLNADAGRALTSARIEDWAGVLPLYAAENAAYPAGNAAFPSENAAFPAEHTAGEVRVSA